MFLRLFCGCFYGWTWTFLKMVSCLVCFAWLNKISHPHDPLKCAVGTFAYAFFVFGVPWCVRWCKQPADSGDYDDYDDDDAFEGPPSRPRSRVVAPRHDQDKRE